MTGRGGCLRWCETREKNICIPPFGMRIRLPNNGSDKQAPSGSRRLLGVSRQGAGSTQAYGRVLGGFRLTVLEGHLGMAFERARSCSDRSSDGGPYFGRNTSLAHVYKCSLSRERDTARA